MIKVEVIITGGSGFIGKRLFEKLPHAVHLRHNEIVKNFSSWESKKLFFLSTYGNMAHHLEHKMMVQANVQDLITVISDFNGWLCYMSSSSVTLPVQTPYSRTKRAAEEILQALPELKSCIVRPFSVFGKNEQKEHLIPTLIRSCVSGELMDFTPWPIHDWISVEDVVNALVLLSGKQSTGIYELGTGVGRNNQEVLETVQEITGRKANIRNVESLRKYDNKEWVLGDLSTRPLGWTPSRDFDKTIQDMVEQYVKELPSLQ